MVLEWQAVRGAPSAIGPSLLLRRSGRGCRSRCSRRTWRSRRRGSLRSCRRSSSLRRGWWRTHRIIDALLEEADLGRASQLLLGRLRRAGRLCVGHAFAHEAGLGGAGELFLPGFEVAGRAGSHSSGRCCSSRCRRFWRGRCGRGSLCHRRSHQTGGEGGSKCKNFHTISPLGLFRVSTRR